MKIKQVKVEKTVSCRRRDDRDRVAGVSDRNRDRDRDFCRRVNRCLEDLLAGAEDRNRDRDRDRDRDRRNRCRWI